MRRARRAGVAFGVALVLTTGVTFVDHGSDSRWTPILSAPVIPAADIHGVDVSAYQHGIDWHRAVANGVRFAYIKATEGSTYTSARFADQYRGAARVGIVRGAYHFAKPNTSSGVAQATFFVNSLSGLGGGLVDQATTLPPLLDLEYNPYLRTDGTNSCWGLTPKQMVRWISQFSDTVISLTGRIPAIYTTTNWWKTCTADSAAFPQNPLFVARFVPSRSPGDTSGADPLPASWSAFTFWQHTDTGTRYADLDDKSNGSVPAGDEDVFRGSEADLQKLARSAFAQETGLKPQLHPLPLP